MNIIISIVTVTYNAEQYIERTLLSILEQQYYNYELIIVDGFSKDNTLNIINSYAEKYNHITIISEKDNGIYDAMNKGAKLAKGKFVIFMNAGDLFFDNNILRKVSPFLCDISNVYYGDAYGIKNYSVIPYRIGAFTKYRLSYTNICHQTIFYPREIFNSHLFDLRYKILADWVFNMSLFKFYNFSYLGFPIALYDLSGVSSNHVDSVFKRHQKNIIVKYLGFSVLIYLLLRKLKKIIKL